RVRHFQGRRQAAQSASVTADPIDDHQDAARLYMSKAVRPTDRQILESADEDKRRVESTTKRDAAEFICFLSFDGQKPGVGASWFGGAELSADNSPWKFGAAYNLARALEAQSKFDEAAAILERDKSPQQLGNRLRAKVLKAREKETKKGP